jgi:PAS domain S-box-containing protein
MKNGKYGRRLAPAVLISAIIFFSNALCTPAFTEDLTAAEKEFLHTRNTVVFVSNTAYPPFEYLDIEGEHIGMSVELARWISTEFGFQARFTDTSLKEAQERVLNGEADVLTSFLYGREYDSAFDFTQPIFNISASLFVASGNSGITSVDDLDGKTVAMQAGDHAREFLLSKGINANVVLIDNFHEAAALAASGQVDAFVGDERIVSNSLHSNHHHPDIKKVGEPIYAGLICMAVADGDSLLLGVLQKGITRAREKGVLELINRKWLGSSCVVCEVPVSFWDRYRTAILIVLVSMASLTLLVWVWNRRLRSQVRNRTRMLSESEETLRTTLEALPVGVILLDEGKINWVNRSVETMFGYEVHELTGLFMRDFYRDTELFQQAERQLELNREQGSNSPVKSKWKRKDGFTFDCSFRSARLAGRPNGSREIIIAEDITEVTAKNLQLENTARVLQSSEKRFRQLFESLIDVYFSLDAKGILTLVSPSVEQILGFSPDEIIGKHSSLYYANKRDGQVLLEKIIKDGMVTNYEVLLKTKNDSDLWASMNARVLQDDAGEYCGVEGQFRDVTQKKRSDQLLRTQREVSTFLSDSESLETALNLCLQAVLMIQGVGGGGVYLFDDDSAELRLIAHLGMSEDFAAGMSQFDFGVSQASILEKGEPFYSFLPDSLRAEGQVESPAGQTRNPGWLAFACFPFSSEGRSIGCINVVSRSQKIFDEFTRFSLEAIAMQIAGGVVRVLAEEAKRVSEERLAAAIDAIDEGFVVFDANDRLLLCNSKYKEMYGKTVDCIKPSARFEDILREGALRGQYAGVDAKNAEEWVAQRLKSHRQNEYNAEVKLDDGRWMKVSERKMKDGSTVGFRVDISDVKKATEVAEKTLREKEVLLKEIHHRVKNNMQVVSSLLSLQAAQIDDPVVESIFAEAQGRVMSMSLVHEILYRSDDLTMIDLHDYLERLIEQVTDLFAGRDGNMVRILLEGESAVLSVDQAAPCGLIVVELLTNAYKYAFPGGRDGEIKVGVRVVDSQWIELSVADNGVGLPADFDPAEGQTLGVRMIVELIEEQLEGEWELSGQSGVHWKLKLPMAFNRGE